MIAILVASFIMAGVFTSVLFAESIVFMLRAEDKAQYNINWFRVPMFYALFWIMTTVSYYAVGILSELMRGVV